MMKQHIYFAHRIPQPIPKRRILSLYHFLNQSDCFQRKNNNKYIKGCKIVLIGIEKIVKVRIRSFGSGNIGFGEQDIRLESSPPLQ